MDHSQTIEQPQGNSTSIGLLFLVMALFIALWESDGRHHQAVAAREARQHQMFVQTKPPASVRLVTQVASHESQFQNIQFPAGIVPGEYRLVSSNGHTASRWITFSDIRLQHMMPGRESRDFYLLDDAEQRIYFIRVTGREKVALRHHN